jgi:hypothetical protein
MAAVQITFQGMFYDKYSRTYYENATMVGIAFLTDLSVGGGPIMPPGLPGGGNRPSNPIALPGDPWWGQDLRPEHPIVNPPLPPDVPQPSPGDPTTPLPPPPGSPGWPVSSMVPPPYIVVQYPGIGPVVVAPPASSTP